MAHGAVPSSQESFYTIADSTQNENLTSSPPILPTTRSTKRKQSPTVTPKRFTRFFTPRSSLGRGSKIGASRQALRDITASGTNRKNATARRRTPTKDSIHVFHDEDESLQISKKRVKKELFTPDTTPDRSSPLKRIRKQSLELSDEECAGAEGSGSEEYLSDNGAVKRTRPNRTRLQCVDPIACSRARGPIGRLLRQETGDYSRRHASVGYGNDEWQHETANFMTRPEDSYACLNMKNTRETAIPFCGTSCNTNSLVAIGDEDGGIRLIETDQNAKPEFSKTYLTFNPHSNAILDLAFSPDDLLLATASGDQTGQVIDMLTQHTIYTMAGHSSTLKQTRFQPGSSSVLATSSRDGSVQIWDLRCKGLDAPVQKLRVSLDREAPARPSNMKYACSTNTIPDAHCPLSTSRPPTTSTSDAPSRHEIPSRRTDISITALSFLPSPRSHLLLTASEANATIKLWDLRSAHNPRSGRRAMPLSSTRQPDAHTQHRQFGITSLALGSDAARLYALCRDSTIYTYSTSHLILGSAPELSLSSLSSTSSTRSRRSTPATVEKEGLAPLYGFRHPRFHASTFYVKLAIRSLSPSRPELLAAGSSDGCPVLFPTDERYLHRHSTLSTSPPSSGIRGRLNDTIPIYTSGTPLIRGHAREVTGLTWTQGEGLVSVSDDCRARCWREDQHAARDLRVRGEAGGRRWGRGWAEVGEGWDDSDCESDG